MTHLVPVLRPVLGSPFRRSDLYRIAGAMPALHLSPRITGTWTDLISGQDLTTFSRANTEPTYELDGVGGLVGFTSGQRAIGVSPETGVRGGSIFGQRTQLRSNPESISTANGYGANSSTLTPGVSASTPIPNVTTATKFALNSGANTGNSAEAWSFGSDVNFTVGTTYWQSVFVKADGVSTFRLRSFVSGQIFDIPIAGPAPLPTGTITGCSVQVLANGWSRIAWSFVAVSGLPGSRADHWGMKSEIANGSSGYLVTGANLTAGSVLYPYIGGQVTVPADVLTIDGTNFSQWYQQAGGTLLVSASRQVVASGDFPGMTYLHAGSSADSIGVGYLVSTVAGFEVNVGGVSQAALYPVIGSTVRKRTVSARFLLNDFAVSINGGALQADTSGTLPTVNQFRIGGDATNTTMNGHIHDILYWPPGSPAESRLQQLSAAL